MFQRLTRSDRLCRLAAGASLLLACGMAHAGTKGGSDQRAKQFLYLNIRKAFSQNVIAIVTQRSSDGCVQQIKIEQSDGRFMRTVLQPLSDQGMIQLDDGQRFITYLPDERLKIDQPSLRYLYNSSRRMSLIDQNYNLTFTDSDRIAGRKTVCVVATPKTESLPTRKYFLDEETAYLLKLDITVQGKTVTPFEAKAVLYPKRMPPGAFNLKVLGGIRNVVYDAPEKVNPKDVERRLGFKPLLPDKVPFGFEVQEYQVANGDEWKPLVIRLTDGLARATIYQWKGEHGQSNIGGNEGVEGVGAGGVRVLLVSDLPQNARYNLLNAYTQSGFYRQMEQGTVPRIHVKVKGGKAGPKPLSELGGKDGLFSLSICRCCETGEMELVIFLDKQAGSASVL